MKFGPLLQLGSVPLPLTNMTLERLLQLLAPHGVRKALASYGIAVAGTSVAAYMAWNIVSYFTSPLRKFPGPFLAGWTNLWRLSIVRTGKYQEYIRDLHEKHGPVVRIGPNLLDLDFPELGKRIYTTDGKWKKTPFYSNNAAKVGSTIVHTLFSTQDPTWHAMMKRPIAKFYSQSGVAPHEPLIESAIAVLCDQLEQRFIKGPNGKQACDLGAWIAYCTWDVVGIATFSERFGYMDKGCDFDNTIAIADQVLDYFSAVGQMPFLDGLLNKNPVVRIGPPVLENVVRIAFEHIGTRMSGADKKYDPNVPDYLQHFIEAQAANPELIDDLALLSYLLVNLIAGADTTALSIRAIWYFLLKNPEKLRKVEAEIRAAGMSTSDVVSFNQARSFPYLEACVREALRLHPGVAMLLERYVPAEGITLPNGQFVPGGAAVGLNPYIIGRNKGVWGADVDEYRPERWLQTEGESEEAFKERMRTYNASDLAFGGGSRVCLGRHLANQEIYKLMATMLNRYDVELVNPEKEWKTTNSWFFRQEGLECYLTERPKAVYMYDAREAV